MDFKTMTLSECGKFDHAVGARHNLTGWGIICKQRSHENSRAQTRKRNRIQRQIIAASLKPRW